MPDESGVPAAKIITEFEIDLRPVIRLADHIRETGEYMGGVDQRRPEVQPGVPRTLYRTGWASDVNGLLFTFETIDYALPLPDGEDGVRLRTSTIDERVYELAGRDWRFRFLFTARNDAEHIFLGRVGYVSRPTLIGNRETFRTDLSFARLCLRLDHVGRSAQRAVYEGSDRGAPFREAPLVMPVFHLEEA
jgi:hypothetical protein